MSTKISSGKVTLIKHSEEDIVKLCQSLSGDILSSVLKKYKESNKTIDMYGMLSDTYADIIGLCSKMMNEDNILFNESSFFSALSSRLASKKTPVTRSFPKDGI